MTAPKEDIPVIDAEPVDSYDEMLAEPDSRQLANAFIHSFGHSLVQGPIDGLTEIVNKLSGKRIIPKVELVKAPDKAEMSTSQWHAQKMGSGAGLIAAGFVIMTFLRRR
ncbi:MAG: hypothetical protein K2Z81_24665 [Cyanobacteria bacterium]|nr:hypothetical protein [Cyanobacteriota bacterium]